MPDISKWNIVNVTNISFMFCNCQSLSNLPDISKWKTNNIRDMNNLFSKCFLLKDLPDISKWDISNIRSSHHLFSYCRNLERLPNFCSWDNSITFTEDMIEGCESLINQINKKPTKLQKISKYISSTIHFICIFGKY